MQTITHLIDRMRRLLGGPLTLGLLLLVIASEPRLPFAASDSGDVHVVDISPMGWRRTVNGWERADDWTRPSIKSQRDINQWIAIENKRESALGSRLLEQLHAVHPLVYSTTLLAIVIGVVLVNERRVKRGYASE